MYSLMQFDGTFAGFLSLLYYMENNNITPSNIISLQTPLSLFDEPFFVKTDTQKSKEFYKLLHNKAPKYALKNFNLAFLYDELPLYLPLYNYINLNPKLLKDETIESVSKVQKYAKYVLKERHKMLGFIRFSKLEDGIFYAKIAPKSNVLALLGNHFRKRFSHEWIIHDTKRDLALIHKDDFLDIQSVQSYEEPTLDKEESTCKELWKKFFTCISIDERKNHKAQRQFVPLFYREFMDEFTD